jgi:hypothetical protein
MTIFDLLFILLFFVAAATLVAAAAFAVRGRWARARSIFRWLAAGIAVYIGIVYLSAAAERRVVLRVGDPQCNDDWCLAVDGVKRTPHDGRVACEINLRIFSRALRVEMHEYGASDVYLVDSAGRRYDPLPRPDGIPLSTLLRPGESVMTIRLFDLPAGARGLGMILGRRGFPGPVCLIICECDAFHGPPIVPLD